MEYTVLNNGIKCPVVGIGTYLLSPEEAENSVREALKMGYSLVDTANAYVNERAVESGRAEWIVRRFSSLPQSAVLLPSVYQLSGISHALACVNKAQENVDREKQ